MRRTHNRKRYTSKFRKVSFDYYFGPKTRVFNTSQRPIMFRDYRHTKQKLSLFEVFGFECLAPQDWQGILEFAELLDDEDDDECED